MSKPTPKPQTEQTEVGVQTLISGVRPVPLARNLPPEPFTPWHPSGTRTHSKDRATLACSMKWGAHKST